MKTNTWDEADRLWDALGVEQPGTDGYDKILEEIRSLMQIQDVFLNRMEASWYAKALNNPVLVGGVIQLLATFIVVNHEQVGIITSKAFNWIRLR